MFFNGIPADAADSYVVNYESNLHSVEFNVRRRLGSHVSLLAGLRAMQLHEGFDILRGDDTSLGFYSKTYNHLWGCQIGGDFRWWLNGVVALNATAKGGLYNNCIEVYATAVDPLSGGTVDLYHDTNDLAIVGEVTAGVLISLGHYAALRLGYMAIVADGIALAPDQNDNFELLTGDGSVDLGSPIYHGGYLGLEFSY